MKKTVFVSIIAIFFNIQGYSQTENIVDLMINSYIKFYELSEKYSKSENQICIEKPDNFYDDFDTSNFNFSKKSSYITIAIDSANARPPLKRELVETSKFGNRKGNFHRGIDLELTEGVDTVYSVFCGTVRYVKYDKKGYGNYLIIKSYNGIEILYAHLDKQPFVKVNEDVKAGDPIGIGGNTGERSTGPHLHFEVNYNGYPINPYDILNKLGLKRKR